MQKELERILSKVTKPARYTGGEYNSIMKDQKNVKTRFAFCFPDVYEIGMSHLGLRILYGVLNQRADCWCERVFAVWPDMEEEMRSAGMKLFALESGDAIDQFDFIAFTLQYEMSYTAVLNMIDLAGLPVYAKDRDDSMPLVIAGGPCAYNPEPLADFVDIFSLGEGEEALCELVDAYEQAKEEGISKREFLIRVAQIPGFYVPSLYQIEYFPDGTIKGITPTNGAPAVVTKRIIQDLDSVYYPEHMIVPSTEIVHDRVVLEVFRGCIRGCRFCQAGYAYRPVRAKRAETLVKQGIGLCEDSGYEEISLASLSTSDYKELPALCDGLLEWCEPHQTSLQLPSLRADNFSQELMQRVQKVRKSGLTFAPEAGSARLRAAINKNLTEEEILHACQVAFEGGWNSVKLYFMIGLPTETDEDIVAIAELAQKVLWTWKRHAANKSRGVKITVSAACFVPKPGTPFQWFGQNTREEFRRKAYLLRDSIKSKAITYNWHEPDTSYLEAVLARGDRRICDVLHEVWKRGARLDGWSEYFDFDQWMEAFAACNISPEFYANRQRGRDEIMPWEHLSTGVTRRHLLHEWDAAHASCISPDCRKKCTGCGASKLLCGGVCDA